MKISTEKKAVINWLTKQGCPALPVAPAQPADQYPARDRQGNIKQDRDGNPLPAFTGKNPSYLDPNGKPHLVNHQIYQKRLSTEAELKKWFANPANGIATLGGWNGIIWIDLDVKRFASREECDRAFSELLAQIPGKTWVEQTHTGGYHIAVRPKVKPTFTNFALTPGGKHVGEALGDGRVVVLAPTVGPSGNSYVCLNRCEPVEVESLEAIGIYPTGKPKPDALRQERSKPTSISTPGSIPLEMLGCDVSRQILNGEDVKGDRSASLTTGGKDWFGWKNWCIQNSVAYSGSAEELAYWAGRQLGLDVDRVARIIKSMDVASCQPAAYLKGGDESCWLKIKRLDRLTFEAKCPPFLKSQIEGKTETYPEQNKEGDVAPGQQKSGSKLAANIAKFSTVFGDRLRFNQVTGFYEFDGKQTTLEDLEIVLALDFDLDAPRNFAAVVKAIAKPYHPVREYFEHCYARYGEMTIEILDGMAERYFGCDNQLYQLFIRKWLIGVARRVFEPGTKFDNVLTLHGKQRLQKSSWFRVLANGWFDDSIGNVSDKDERTKLHHSLINEWAELESVFKRKDIAQIKSFITTQVDRLRPPYGREVVDMKRWSVIVGSTNQDEFLADATGNRRFWVIPVKKRIDLDLLEQERDQIWAAAVALYFQGEQHWLDETGETAAAEAVTQYQTSDPWESAILEYLDASGRTEIAVEELLSKVLEIELKDQDRQKQMRLADILKRAGWSRSDGRAVRNGKRVRLWQRPEPEPEAELLTQESASTPTSVTDQSQTQSSSESTTVTTLVARYSLAFKQATHERCFESELHRRLAQLMAELKLESDMIRQQVWETLPVDLQRLIQFKVLKTYPELAKQAAPMREDS